LVFAGLVLLYTLVSFTRAMALFKIILKSISNMLQTVTERVLRSQIVFFDSNPIGRILTRFTKDVVVFDLLFPMQFLMFINGILRSLTVVITIAVINPYVLIPAAIVLVMMIFILKLGNKAMADAQRLDSLEREPIHNTFSMMITGLVSCRVSGKIEFFKHEFMNSLYRGSNAMFCNNSISRWIGLRLDLLCVAFTSSVTWFCLIMKGHVQAKILLVTLQIISDLIAWFSYSIRLYADLENSMTCS
jgi:ATP-binding cassette subfamily C (CFTR/MRP) protein 4